MISAVRHFIQFAQDALPVDVSSTESVDSSLAIAARGLDMVFNPKVQPFQALRAVNLTVPKGAIQMIVGPSGAGKTTLLLILAGLLTPTAGQVFLLGEDITRMNQHQLTQFRLHHIGVLFEESHLLRSLTALENVEIVLNLKGIQGYRARQEAQRLLDAVGLSHRAHHLPRQLSGGEQQRVAIARALTGNPALIFADEPTAALDSRNGCLAVELLRKLAKEEGCTVVMATHDPRILHFADQIDYLEDGVLSENRPDPETWAWKRQDLGDRVRAKMLLQWAFQPQFPPEDQAPTAS